MNKVTSIVLSTLIFCIALAPSAKGDSPANCGRTRCGIVSRFDEPKGYGWIRDTRKSNGPTNSDIFVWFGDIILGAGGLRNFKYLEIGSRVVYDIGMTPNGPKAVRVCVFDNFEPWPPGQCNR